MALHELTTSPLLILAVGICLTSIGYGPLSRRKNPQGGAAFLAAGFLLRLAGPLFLLWDALLWLFIASMSR